MSDTRESLEPLQSVLNRVLLEGISVEELTNWHLQNLTAFILGTISDASYLVEPQHFGQRALITRIAEHGHGIDYDCPPTDLLIVRTEGNPDRHTSDGGRITILR